MSKSAGKGKGKGKSGHRSQPSSDDMDKRVAQLESLVKKLGGASAAEPGTSNVPGGGDSGTN